LNPLLTCADRQIVNRAVVCTRVTPHDEFQLIRDNVPSAAIALGLSLLGFVLPVVSAIAGDTSRFLPRTIL
jgi:uncharacterized membrane protein YjfL (UPF0719 family)